MKKIAHFFSAAALAACFITASSQQAQAQSYVNVGVGLGRTFVGAGADFSVPPISLSYEKTLFSTISVGGLVGYARASGFNFLAIGPRAAYHLPVPVPNLDTYVGGMIGYKRGFGGGVSSGDVMGAGHIGGRYTFGGIGAFAEVGYGYAILNLGLTIKM